VILIIWFRSTWDYFEKKRVQPLAKSNRKLKVKTLQPIAVIKQNKHQVYLREMEQRN
jgi:hypothetical protein